MKFRILAILLYLQTVLIPNCFPQMCGTMVDQGQIQFENNFSNAYRLRSSSTVFTPVKFRISVHFITYNGFPSITEETLRAALEETNRVFDTVQMSFEICQITYTTNNALFNFLSNAESALLATGFVDSTINLYITGGVSLYTPPNPPVTICGYTHMPGQGPEMIVAAGSCIPGASVLTHELGHFFNLYHTHETAMGRELANGTNCSTSGDLLCGTPADPLLGTNNVNSSCVYTGTSLDSIGAPFHPDPLNLMSYTPDACRKHFSPDQFNRMRFTADNYRSYLKTFGFSYTQSDSLICPGQSVTLAVNNGSSPYLWSTSETTSQIFISPASTTSVNLTFPYAGCSINHDFNIDVLPQNSVFSSGSYQCPGSTPEIEISNSAPGIIYSMTSNGVPNGNSQPGTGGDITLTTDPIQGSAYYTIHATSPANQCSYALTDSTYIPMMPYPPTNINIRSADDTVCLYQYFYMYIDSTVQGYYYQVVIDDTIISNPLAGNGGTLQINNSGTEYNQVVTVRVMNSCDTLPCPDTLFLTAGIPPVRMGSLDDDSICSGTSAVFHVYNSVAGVEYRIITSSGNINSTVMGTGGDIVITSTPLTSSISLYLTGYSSAGCFRNVIGPTNVFVENVNTNVDVNHTILYPGDSITFTNTSQVPVHNWMIQWDGQILNDTASIPSTLFYQVPGNNLITYTGTTTMGCSKTDSIALTVLPSLPVGNGTFCYMNDSCFYRYFLCATVDQCGNSIFGGFESEFGGYKPYIEKLDSAGNFLWETEASLNQFGSSGVVNAIASDDFGNIYAGGTYNSRIMRINNVQIGSNIFTATNRWYVVKFNPDGTLGWQIYGELVSPANIDEVVSSIVVGQNGHVYFVQYGESYLNIHFTDTTVSHSSIPRAVMTLFEVDTAGNFIAEYPVEFVSPNGQYYFLNDGMHFANYAGASSSQRWAVSPSLSMRRNGDIIFSGLASSTDTFQMRFGSHLTKPEINKSQYYYSIFRPGSGWQNAVSVGSSMRGGCKGFWCEESPNGGINAIISTECSDCLNIGMWSMPDTDTSFVGETPVYGNWRSALMHINSNDSVDWFRLSRSAVPGGLVVTSDGHLHVPYSVNSLISSIPDGYGDSVYLSSGYRRAEFIATYDDAGRIQSSQFLNETSSYGIRPMAMEKDKSDDLLISAGAETWSVPGIPGDSCANGQRVLIAKYSPQGFCSVPSCDSTLSTIPGIVIHDLSSSVLCVGDTSTFTITFSTQNISFNPGNKFYLRMSSSTGNLSTGIILDSTTTNQFSIFFSDTTAAGLYYFRIESSLPAFNGSVSSFHVAVSYPTPHVAILGDTVSCGSFQSYQWYYNGIIIAGATNATFVAQSSGFYSCAVVDFNGCPGQSDSAYFSPVGINEIAKAEFSIFPNPTHGLINVLCPINSGTLRIELINVLGKTLYISPEKECASVIPISYDFETPGIYLVKIVSKHNTRSVFRILVQ